MAGRTLGPIAAAGLAAGAALVACFDVLHSTADIRAACEIDPSLAGCSTDFCAWSADEAEAHALHACAWLGACETPMGNDAFGPCMFRARMAYDCKANPQHAVRGAAHAVWDCLQRARSCAEVDACVFEQHEVHCQPTATTGTACVPTLPDLRVACDAADGGTTRPRGENCALSGQTCDPVSATCTGRGSAAACSRTCEDGLLHWCSVDPTAVLSADAGSAVDEGIDCTNNGAGACAFVPPNAAVASWVACEPASSAGACTPDASASCTGGVATSCLTGHLESVDCDTLLGSPGACTPGPLAPLFDWTSPCSLSPPQCSDDTCNGDLLTSCERGAPFNARCSSQGLGPCRLVATEEASAPRAACTPPADAGSGH
jgi:hypothetical protein